MVVAHLCLINLFQTQRDKKNKNDKKEKGKVWTTYVTHT